MPFLLVDARKQYICDVSVERMVLKKLRNLGIESFFPNVRLAAPPVQLVLFAASVVRVALLNFSGDRAVAFRTTEQTEERFGDLRNDSRGPFPALAEDKLYAVKCRFIDYRLVCPGMHVPGPSEMAVVDRIFEHLRDSIARENLAGLRRDAICNKELAKGIEGFVASRISFEGLAYHGCSLWIGDDSFDSSVVQIAEWSDARILADANLFPEAALRVLRHRIDVVFTLTERHREHEFPLRRWFEPERRKTERAEFSGVDEIDDATSIGHVSSESVGVPREYSVGIAAFDPLQHRIEVLPLAGCFCRFFFDNGIANRD